MPHLGCAAVAPPQKGCSSIGGDTSFDLLSGIGASSERNKTNGGILFEGGTAEDECCFDKKEAKRKSKSNGMCPPLTEDSLSTSLLNKLAELRARLGDQLLRETPLFDDNFSLIRWLHGWDNKIEEIVPRFKRASEVFHCMRVNELLFEDVDALNDFTRQLTSAADFYPGGALGFDREGNVLVMQTTGRSHPKQLAKCGRVSDAFKLCIVENALFYQLIRMQERKHRRKLGLRVIIDLEGFNTDHLTTMGLKVYGSILKMMQDLFPDLLRQVYVINAHYLVKTAYTFIKPMLSEQSREKVVFLDSAYHEQLARDVGRENLFPRWGGTRQPTNGHPEWGTLRVGGVPPKEKRYTAASNPEHMTEDKLTKLVVPARQKRFVDVSVPGPPGSPPQTLYWFWTSSSDIDFGVFTEEEREVWPMCRLLTDFVPEFGSIPVEAGCNYKLCFDNSFSMITKKEIKYCFRLTPLDVREMPNRINSEKFKGGEFEKSKEKKKEEETVRREHLKEKADEKENSG